MRALKQPFESDYRTLVIGVGGSGVKTLSALKIELDRRFEDWNTSLQLFAVDTSIDELSKSGLDSTNEIFNLTCPAAANSFDIVGNRHETVNDWINPNFNQGSAIANTNGAGQIRQISIGKLYYNYEGAYNAQLLQMKIFNKITTLNINRGAKPLQIFIVLGLAGGTGSGLVNDIAVLTRLALKSVDATLAGSNIIGYLYLPDTVLNYAQANVALAMESNGYAALKEVDYFYSRFQRHPDFTDRFIYPDQHHVYNVDAAQNFLYNSIYLLSKNGPDADRDCRISIVESMLSLVSGKNKEIFSALAFMDNEVPHRTATLSVNQVLGSGDDHPEDSFHYFGLGVHAAGLPTDVIKAWALNQVVSALYKSYGNNAPGGIENGFSRLPLSKEEAVPVRIAVLSGYGWTSPAYGNLQGNLEDKLKIIVEKWVNNTFDISSRNIPAVSGRDIKTKSDRYKNYRNILDGLGCDENHNPITDINEMLRDQANRYCEEMLKFICENGPIVAEHVLDGRVTNGGYVGIQDTINGLYGVIKTIKSNAEIDKQKAFANMEDIPTHFFFDVNNWKDAYKDWLKACALSYICGHAGSALKENYLDPVNKLNNQIRDFVKVLDALMEVYKTAGAPFESLQQLTDYCIMNHPIMLNLINNSQSYNWVKSCATQAASAAKKKGFRVAIMQSFSSNRDEWTNETVRGTTVPARKLFDKCLEELKLVGILDKELMISNFVYAICSEDGGNISQKIKHYYANLVTVLMASTKILYAQSEQNSYGGKQKYILYPEGITTGVPETVITQAEIKAQISASASGAGVVASKLSDQIVSYEIKDALPLFSLKDIERWEKSYLEMSRIGSCHRNESGHVDFSTLAGDNKGGNPLPHGRWVNYPNPGDARDGKYDPKRGLAWRNYPHLALRTTSNLEENLFLEGEFKETWNKGLEYEIIEMYDDGPPGETFYFKCRIFADPKGSVNVDDLEDYNVIDDNGILALGKPLLNFLAIKANEKAPGGALGGAPTTKNGKFYDLKLLDSGYLSNGSVNKINAETNAMRVLRRNVPLYVALKRSIEMLKPIIEKVNESNEPVRQQRLLLIAVDAIAWGLIKLKDNTVDQWIIKPNFTDVGKNFGPVTNIVALDVAFLKGKEHGFPYEPDRKIVDKYSLIPLCRAFVRYIEKQGKLRESTLAAFINEIKSIDEDAQKECLEGNSYLYEEAIKNMNIFSVEANEFISKYSSASVRDIRTDLASWQVGAKEKNDFINNALEIYKKVKMNLKICTKAAGIRTRSSDDNVIDN
ncbi:MAG: tubulin-like doman-containing protein [Clostridiales bacterium]|nr:tubulin-like doman-containing protein [Clostridiales bacterium]